MRFVFLIAVVWAIRQDLNTQTSHLHKRNGGEKKSPLKRPRDSADLSLSTASSDGSVDTGVSSSLFATADSTPNRAPLIDKKEINRRNNLRRLELKMQKRKEAELAKKLADEKAAKAAAEKQLRKSPVTDHPDIIPTTVQLLGESNPVEVKVANGFDAKHIKGLENGGANIGQRQSILLGQINAFEPAAAIPNPKGVGERVDLVSKHNVNIRTMKKTESGREEGTPKRGRAKLSGAVQKHAGKTVVVIDHYDGTLSPIASPVRATRGTPRKASNIGSPGTVVASPVRVTRVTPRKAANLRSPGKVAVAGTTESLSPVVERLARMLHSPPKI